ncbi:putative transcriptional regulator [Bacillus sp. TS-2]|nr:putative transcriptional regulator [Bacillus sp. TS-2]
MNTEKLLRLFDSAIIKNSSSQASNNTLRLMIEEEVIHFDLELLTEKEVLLLKELFNEPITIPAPQSPLEEKWRNWLIHDSPSPPIKSQVRFIHFLLDKSIDDYQAFHEIWDSLLEKTTSIIWISPTYGIVIHIDDTLDDEVEYQSLIEAMSTDFYVNLSLLMGSQTAASNSKSQFLWEKKCFEIAKRHHQKKHYFDEHEASAIFLLSFIPSHDRTEIIEHFFNKELLEDQELLKSVSVYLKNHLNLSSAAKALHMHRNSLQYRIDKFIDKTGIDIKQFPQAAFLSSLLQLIHYKI